MTTPGRPELAATLQRLVDASGLDDADIARTLDVSPSTLYRWLHARTTPSAAAVRSLIDATGQAGTDDALEAARIVDELPSGNQGRIVLLRSESETGQRRWREEATQAAAVEEYALTMPSGFLQTRAYMRAIFSAGGRTSESIAGAIGNRLGSQELLEDGGHRFTLVMPEGVFRWPAVSPAVMREQLAHIAAVARRDTGGRVRIGIIPSWRPVDIFPMTNFTIYDRRLVVIGTDYVGTAFIDRPLDVERYVGLLGELGEFAQWGPDAATECERIAADYRG
jgi:transcriptional regulator with XRE-family HTH domain